MLSVKTIISGDDGDPIQFDNSAISQLEAHDTLAGDVYVPFHAVDVAFVDSRAVTPVTPSDDICGGGEADLPTCENIKLESAWYESTLPTTTDKTYVADDSSQYIELSTNPQNFTDVMPTINEEPIENFEIWSSDPDFAYVDTAVDQWGTKIGRIMNHYTGSDFKYAYVVVRFPDYGCQLQLGVYVNRPIEPIG